MRIAILITALCIASAMPLWADAVFGTDARLIAMGGAGLAVTDRPTATAALNPAALGLLNKGIRLVFPTVSFRVEGASVGDITSWANDLVSISGQESIDLAREFGKRDTMIDVNASTGFAGSPLSVTLDGEARARIIPNASFREFAETGVLPAYPSTMQAVVWGEAAISEPSVGFGIKVPHFATGNSDLWLGTRLRWVLGKYVRRTVSWSGSSDPNNALAITSEPVQDESGVAGDFGAIYRTDSPSVFTVGVAATNLLKPNLSPIEQDTILSIGMSVKPHSKILIAADIVNLTNGYDEGTKLRIGVEAAPVSVLAVRAGYSGDAFTYGFGLFGIDLAFSSKTPLSIARTIRF